MVTSRCTPSEPALDVTGPQPRSLQTTGEQTWQVCAAYLDKPTGNILTQDGRIWFNSTLREFSGSIEVGVTEAAALKAADLSRRVAFQTAFDAGALQLGCCNVRGGRTVRDGEVRYTIMMYEPTQDIVPLTANARGLYDMLRARFRREGSSAACLRSAAGAPERKMQPT